jgi:ankyrin repeat protein
MAAIPLLFGFLCLGKLINGLVFYNELSVPKIFINLTLLIIIMSMLSIFSLIHLQRNAHQKKEKANFFLAVFALGCGFIAFVLYASSERLGVLIVETFPLLGHSFFSFSTFFSWWSVPALVLIGIFFHYRLLRFWTNEKFSYREKTLANNLNFQYSVMATGSMLLIYAFTALYLDIPLIYKGRVTEAVFRGQLEEVKAALSFAPDINAKNQYGLTPMMAAVRAGDLKLVKFLHEKGANFEGTVVNAPGEFNGIDVPGLAIKSKNKSLVDFLLSKNVNFNLVNAVTGNAPIHMAAFICDSQMVDSLIKHGSDVNIINVKGQTPLILAAQKGCLSASIVLKEAGARFDIVDKEGKMALDRAGESKINESELKYFLEKNTRTPASH